MVEQPPPNPNKRIARPPSADDTEEMAAVHCYHCDKLLLEVEEPARKAKKKCPRCGRMNVYSTTP